MRLAVRDVPGFEVVEDLALSTFSFAKYLMWKDLVDRTNSLRENRLVRHLIDNPDVPFASNGDRLPEPPDVDRRPASTFVTPLPADSSQLAAVMAATEGHDFVIIGPPGTGKSQTIANIIAQCLSSGRTVLFVAEKSAALDVVHRRLKAHGLSDACLELHSNHTDRKSVIGQLGRSWDRATAANDREWIALTEDLTVHRDHLNEYVAVLHRPGSHGRSVFEAIGIVAGSSPSFELSWPTIDAHDAESFEALKRLAENLGRTHETVRGCRALVHVSPDEWSFGWQRELETRLGQLDRAGRDIIAASATLERFMGLPQDPALPAPRLALLRHYAAVAEKTAAEDFRAALDEEFGRYDAAVERLGAAITALREERHKLSAEYPDEEIMRMPLDELDRDRREAQAKSWPFSKMAMGRVRKLMQTYARSGMANPETDIAALRAMRERLPEVTGTPLAGLPVFDGEDTDTTRMRTWLTDAADIRALIREIGDAARDTQASTQALAGLLDPRGRSHEALTAVGTFKQALGDWQSALAALREHAGGMPEDEGVGGLVAWARNVAAEKDRLRDWTRWVAEASAARSRGLGALIDALGDGKVENTANEFETAYFTWWLPLAIDADPALRGFLHWDHESRIERFRELDEAVQKLAAEQVIRAVSHGLPARDGVPRKSELGTLRHQLGLQRPSVSIRDLIRAMPTTFSKLAPCVLMSPLSIAQYLPADRSAFDVVVFDEASQITTWDAVGAIAGVGSRSSSATRNSCRRPISSGAPTARTRRRLSTKGTCPRSSTRRRPPGCPHSN